MSKKLMFTVLSLTVTFALCHLTVLAAIDAYEFPNQELEARYHRLIDELRCPQCLNTNLAGSDAMIAQDLRREVHEQLLQGKNDEEILLFMRERYGDFILYRPRIMISTLLLWLGPLLVLTAGGIWVFRTVKRSGSGAPAVVSVEDENRLQELLDHSNSGNSNSGHSNSGHSNQDQSPKMKV